MTTGLYRFIQYVASKNLKAESQYLLTNCRPMCVNNVYV